MKMRILIILCFIGLSTSSCKLLITDNLSISDIEKYSDNIKIRYTIHTYYGNKSYVLNMYDNSILDTTYEKNDHDTNDEFNGYRVDKIKGIKAIYDNDNNVILDLDIVAQKFGYKSYECRLLKYDEINGLLYMVITDSYTCHLLFTYNINNAKIDEITKISPRYGERPVFYKLNNSIIYVLNDKNELCEYNFEKKRFKNLFIKPIYYSVSNDKIVYYDGKFVYEYDKESATIKKIIKKRHIEEIDINKDGTFLLTIETMFGQTKIYDRFLYFNTHSMNCLKIYELSTGKSKVLVNGNKEYYIIGASFLK